MGEEKKEKDILKLLPAPKVPPTTRAVALGDSVPYGHGLANPYLLPQIGLPAAAVSQGPSTRAYPTMVAAQLGLTPIA